MGFEDLPTAKLRSSNPQKAGESTSGHESTGSGRIEKTARVYKKWASRQNGPSPQIPARLQKPSPSTERFVCVNPVYRRNSFPSHCKHVFRLQTRLLFHSQFAHRKRLLSTNRFAVETRFCGIAPQPAVYKSPSKIADVCQNKCGTQRFVEISSQARPQWVRLP
jgi:hypothetical protein